MSEPAAPPPTPIEPWEVLDLLTSLVQKSLVVYEEDEQGQGRYRLLEPTRQYARDRLLEAEEAEAVRERHFDWCLVLAEEAEPELEGAHQREWLDRLQREHDNLRAALAWSEAQGHAQAGLRLGGALSWFWKMRDEFFGEGRERLARLLALPGAEARTAARAKALQGAGDMARLRSDLGAARSLLDESLAIHRERGDHRGTAWSLIFLGAVTRHQDNAAARVLVEESLAIFRQLGDKWGIAMALWRLAELTGDRGDYGAARGLFEESLAIYRELQNRLGIAWSLDCLGGIARRQGDSGEAFRMPGRLATDVRNASAHPLRGYLRQARGSHGGTRTESPSSIVSHAWSGGRNARAPSGRLAAPLSRTGLIP